MSTSNAPLGLASGFQFKRGTDVVIIGNPSIGGESILPNAITRGILSTLYTHEGQSLYQLSASVNHGNSGGPVIDLTGRVIGITLSKAKNVEGIAFCIPVEDMLSAVSKVQSASALEKERATSLHRVSVIIYHLKQFQELLSNASIGYANYMRMLAQNGSLKNSDLDAAASVLRPEALGLDKRLLSEELRSEMWKVLDDPSLPTLLRRRMRDAINKHIEMLQYFIEPSGSIKDFLRRNPKNIETAILSLNEVKDMLITADN